MSSSGPSSNADTGRHEPPPQRLPSLRLETRTLLAIATPLAMAYLADFAMALTTKVIVGRLGYRELAGIGLASDIASNVLIVLVGFLSVVGVLVAQAEGGDKKAAAGVAARQGFIIATVLGLPAVALVWHLDVVLSSTGQDPELIALMGPFLEPRAMAMLPMLWFFVLRTFAASLARTGAIMAITIVAVGVNYVLCLGLVEGAFGLPKLGVAGAGWSRLCAAVFMLVALLAHTYFTPAYRGYGLYRGRLTFEPAVCREIFWLGIPVAGIVMLESGLFAAVSILSGVLGPIPLATYQIMIAWIGLAFMTAHGLAEAGMVRVAHGIGSGSIAAARRAGILTIAIGVAWLVALTAIPLNFPQMLVRMFLDPQDPGFSDVLTLTTRLLVLAAFFQVFDGLQVIASLALRGLKDTVVPLWLAALGYWVLGVGGGWLLAFPLDQGADGLWWGLALGLTVTGSMLAVRFLMLTRQPRN